MSLTYIPKAIKQAVLARAGGRCESCGSFADRFEYDHHIPEIFSGRTDIENVRQLCIPCHRRETRKLQAALSKVKRISAAKVTGPLSARIEAAIAMRPRPKQRDLISLLRSAVTALKAHDE